MLKKNLSPGVRAAGIAGSRRWSLPWCSPVACADSFLGRSFPKAGRCCPQPQTPFLTQQALNAACGQLPLDGRDWCRMACGPHVSGEGLPRSSECADWPGLEGAGPFQGGTGRSREGAAAAAAQRAGPEGAAGHPPSLPAWMPAFPHVTTFLGSLLLCPRISTEPSSFEALLSVLSELRRLVPPCPALTQHSAFRERPLDDVYSI